MEPIIGQDVWQMLREGEAPVVMYGTGNGADKLLEVFRDKGIRCDGFFASDGFVRNRTFHGFPVLSYEQARAAFGDDMRIAVGFASSRPEVMETLGRLSHRHRVVMPPVPVIGSLTEQEGKGGIFDGNYYRRHLDAIQEASTFFLDETSAACYNEIIRYRLSGDLSHLDRCAHTPADWYGLLHSEAFRTCMDLGAYNGDTLREMQTFCPNLKKAVAAEPDPHTFLKLQTWAQSQKELSVTLYQKAAWDTPTALEFAKRGNRGSGQGKIGKTVKIEALPPDCMAEGEWIDYIKYDVEGAEERALAGSEETIRRCHPALLISAYHRTEDLFALPLFIKRHFPFYRLALRRGKCYPDWEIQLLAIPEN